MTDEPAGHQPELLTITEAAALLRAPVATLRYWRHHNTGPRSFRIGRRVLYRRSDLHAWVEDQERKSLLRTVRTIIPSAAKSTVNRPHMSRTKKPGATEPEEIEAK